MTTKSLGITVAESKSGAVAPSFNGTNWDNRNTVVVKKLSAGGKLALAGFGVGDTINSITINEKVYNLYYDYSLDNLLLLVSVPETTVTIKFNITSLGETKDIEVVLTASDFVEVV